MGLDIVTSCDEYDGRPSWSYPGFHVFRRILAAAEGFELDRMEGFVSTRDPLVEGLLREATVSSSWPWTMIGSPLVPLLHHSDCDGDLGPDEAKTIVLGGLGDILDRWEVAQPDDPSIRFYVAQGRALVDLLWHVADHGCTAVFR